MSRRLTPSQCVVAGLLITVMQIAVAVAFARTDGSLADRYLALVQHDSYWFANIIDRGYGTIVPPIERKEMEVSNVAFFPGYPILAGALKQLTGLSTGQSLLLIAQAAACGFWTYFFLFAKGGGSHSPFRSLARSPSHYIRLHFSWWRDIRSRSFSSPSPVSFTGARVTVAARRCSRSCMALLCPGRGLSVCRARFFRWLALYIRAASTRRKTSDNGSRGFASQSS